MKKYGGGYVMDKMRGGGMQIWKKPGGCRGGGGVRKKKRGYVIGKKPGGWGWVGRIIRGG